MRRLTCIKAHCLLELVRREERGQKSLVIQGGGRAQAAVHHPSVVCIIPLAWSRLAFCKRGGSILVTTELLRLRICAQAANSLKIVNETRSIVNAGCLLLEKHLSLWILSRILPAELCLLILVMLDPATIVLQTSSILCRSRYLGAVGRPSSRGRRVTVIFLILSLLRWRPVACLGPIISHEVLILRITKSTTSIRLLCACKDVLHLQVLAFVAQVLPENI